MCKEQSKEKNPEKKNWKCSKCQAKYSNEGKYKKHVKECKCDTKNQEPCQASTRPQSTNEDSELEKHFEILWEKFCREEKCSNDATFGNLGKNLEKKHEVDNKIKSSITDETMTKPTTANKNSAQKNQEESLLQCPFCEKQFQSELVYRKHMKKHETGVENGTASRVGKGVKPKEHRECVWWTECPVCWKKCENEVKFRKHVAKHYKPTKESSTTPVGVSGDFKEGKDEPQSYRCKTCFLHFKNVARLQKHEVLCQMEKLTFSQSQVPSSLEEPDMPSPVMEDPPKIKEEQIKEEPSSGVFIFSEMFDMF